MQASRIPLKTFESLNRLVDLAIYKDKHNIIIIWAPLGKGKTSLMLQMLHRLEPDWRRVLSFELEPHTCIECGYSWDAKTPYIYELPCPSCNKETSTTDVKEARQAARKKLLVIPFPFDYDTGRPLEFAEGTVFSINTSRARGEMTQKYPYLNFTFNEFKDTIKNAAETRIPLRIIGWDDIAVYFHRSNIQYMHPDVKNFFSRYNFVRKYVKNVIVTVPTPDFVPDQLYRFATADIMLQERGEGDFDTILPKRNFWGAKKTFLKHYDGRDVTWKRVPDQWFKAYEEVRHAHAVAAFEKPEEVFVTTMPKTKRYTEEESLF